jgi:hypothetical protein
MGQIMHVLGDASVVEVPGGVLCQMARCLFVAMRMTLMDGWLHTAIVTKGLASTAFPVLLNQRAGNVPVLSQLVDILWQIAAFDEKAAMESVLCGAGLVTALLKVQELYPDSNAATKAAGLTKVIMLL